MRVDKIFLVGGSPYNKSNPFTLITLHKLAQIEI